MAKTPTILLCPHCSSTKIIAELGGLTGELYHCLNCNYIGPVVIERDLTDEELKLIEDERRRDEEAKAKAKREKKGKWPFKKA
ncbi:MAG TPA: hypothetical protein VMS79_00180 [Methanomassiliicoccales archaeon]|nr:hypothetical protein [Methanomassiliicoccales archaeon]